MSKRRTPEEQPKAKRIRETHASAYLDSLASTLMQITSNEVSLTTLSSLDECKELVKANPDLERALQGVQGVMSLPILQKQVGEASNQPKPTGVAEQIDKSLDATFKAFHAPYIPGFPEALLETLDNYYGHSNVYNNAISIIQSSGTGKSRGVAEAAQIRFSFLFNVRCEIIGFTYPPPDVTVREYFVDHSHPDIERKYTAFFIALFDCAWELLSNSDRMEVPLAKWWYGHLNGNATHSIPDPRRTEFYDRVIEVARVRYNEANTDLTEVLKCSCEDFVTYLKSQYRRDEPHKASPEVACLLVFDEAQELANSPRKRQQQTLYHHLGSVLKTIKSFSVFSVFLSTNSNILSLAPSVPLHSSIRDVLDSYPPINELPFDVFARNLYDELREYGNSTLSVSSTVNVVARFGRPMWFSLHKNGYRDIVDLAKAKLNPTHKFSLDNRAKLACLAIRIGLDFDASRKAARMEEIKLVELYMRVVSVTPAHREYMWTGTPSEPILAEAAAQLLNNVKGTTLLKLAPNILNDAFQQGFLARGERGEMVGRLLWTLAHDQVLSNKKREEHEEVDDEEVDDDEVDDEEVDDDEVDDEEVDEDEHAVKFHRPIRVLDFLRALFHEDHWNEISSAKPMGDDEEPSLSEAFKDAYIHFSHFMNGEYYKIDLHRVYQLLLRGAALSCQRNQRSIDFLTPILFGHPKKTKISKSNTSVLQAQIKNRDTKGDEIYIDPSLVQTKHPVLSLVHHLGTPASSVESTRYFQSGETLHKRHYQIVSYGCSSETFRVIDPTMDSTIYPMLLASNLLMEDFPRKNIQNSFSLFRQLDPCAGLEEGDKCMWVGEEAD